MKKIEMLPEYLMNLVASFYVDEFVYLLENNKWVIGR